METQLNLLGKWYASEPTRYYKVVLPINKNITHYKMYVTKVTETEITYDSFLLFEDGTVKPSKVNKVTTLDEFANEVRFGYLTRSKEIRNSLDAIGRKYNLDITVL